MSYDPVKLNERHYILLRMAVAGSSREEMHDATGLSLARIGVILNSARFKARYNELQERINGITAGILAERCTEDPVTSYLKSQALCSAQTLVQLRDTSSKDEVRLRSAESILNRTNYGEHSSQTLQATVSIPDKQIDLLARALGDMSNTSRADISEQLIEGDESAGLLSRESPKGEGTCPE